MIDPSLQNITGIALMRNEDPFEDPNVELLYANTSVTDLMNTKDLESATFFPKGLLYNLRAFNLAASSNESQIDNTDT